MAQAMEPPASLDAADWPIVLLAGRNGARLSADELMPELARMGLKPEIRDALPAPLAAMVTGPGWYVSLGTFGAWLARADEAGHAVRAALDGSATTAGAVQPTGTSAADWFLLTQAEPAGGARAEATRELLKLTCLAADTLGATHFYWSPAALWSEIAALRTAVSEMLSSGMPPVLHLVAFLTDASGHVATRGLGYFAGQELAVVQAGGLGRADQVRRLARLAIDMMANGPISGKRRFPGLSSGETVAVDPAEGGLLAVHFETR
jgi:hypothetical protein